MNRAILALSSLSLVVVAGCGEEDTAAGDAAATANPNQTGGAGGPAIAPGPSPVTPNGPDGPAPNPIPNGPATACSSNCSNPPSGSCESPTVRITEVDVGMRVLENESETELQPLSLAAIPSGGSRLAWLSDDGRVHIGQLDCSDQLVGTPFGFEANDYQDLAADDQGGVVLLTRDAQGGGTLNCGTPSNLCDGGPQPPIPCFDMFLLRYDCAGNSPWSTLLTTATRELPPYSTGPNGPTVHMIWWYQHQGRIAYDGSNYAAYFCDAISISEGGCINIHQGDRMQVVGPEGSIVDHPDAFAGGCSHSWNTRIVWDEANARFVMVCATDNVGRVAMPAPYRTVFTPEDLGSLSVGDVIVGKGGSYWVTATDQGTIHLLEFTDGAATRDLEVGNSDFSHLAKFGDDHLLVAWEAGSGITAQVRDLESGDVVSGEFPIDVPDNRYQSFESFADGSVAYAAPGGSDTTIRIARVLPCP